MFGCLKGCWGILLKEIYCTDIERIIRTIHACCILHNFCIDMDDLYSLKDNKLDDGVNSNENESVIADKTREETAGI